MPDQPTWKLCYVHKADCQAGMDSFVYIKGAQYVDHDLPVDHKGMSQSLYKVQSDYITLYRIPNIYK